VGSTARQHSASGAATSRGRRSESSAPLDELEVRPIQVGDAALAAGLHDQALPHTFFAALGVGFLRAYWRALATDPRTIGFVAARGEEAIGFVVGTSHPREQRRRIVRRHGARLLVLGAAGLARNPPQAVRFLRTRSGRYCRALRRYLRARSETLDASTGPGARQDGVLSHVMVSADVRAHGIGRALIDAFLRVSGEAGVTNVQLVTLGGERGASGFWRRLGWASAGAGRDADGRLIERFAHTTTVPARPAAVPPVALTARGVSTRPGSSPVNTPDGDGAVGGSSDARPWGT